MLEGALATKIEIEDQRFDKVEKIVNSNEPISILPI